MMYRQKNENRPAGIAASVSAIRSGKALLGFACLCFTSSFAQQPPPPTTPLPAQHAQHSTDLPPGTGRDTVVRVCGKCHSSKILVANPRTREAWEDTITKMAGLGAVATDEEFTDILDYLSKNVSPEANAKINVNKATVTELQTNLDLSAKDAEAIVAFRTKNGDFKCLADLEKVPKVDTKKLDDEKDKLIFN